MPLPEELLTRVRTAIIEAEKAIPDMQDNLRDARKAGIDTSAQTVRLQEAKNKLARMKSVYGEQKRAARSA